MTNAAQSFLGSAARRFPRRHIRGQALTKARGRTTYAQVMQIGEGGMLLTTLLKVKVGQVMNVQFVLPDAKLDLLCEILYIVPKVLSSPGMCVGVRFYRATEGQRAAIRAFVHKSTVLESTRRKLK